MRILLPLLTFFASVFSAPNVSGHEAFDRARSFDAQHYTIHLSFDRKYKKVFGDSTIKLKPLKDNFKIVELDAHARIRFRSVKLAPLGTPLKFRKVKNRVLIILDRPYRKSDLISLRFVYETKPKKGIYFVDAIRKNKRTARSAQIWTQGESQETHHWLPSFDFPSDKATTEQFITVPSDEIVIGNGELASSNYNPDGTITFHHKMDIPHSLYLTSFVVGKYLKISEKYKNVPLNYYVYPGQESLVPKAYGKTKDMFRIYEQLTKVSYPYNKYDQTIVAKFGLGGMENITATTLSDSEVMLAEFDFGRGVVEDLVAHELAHSWFGNLVTCKNWAELWLNEGFATFMEAAYREKMYGRKDYLRKISDDAGTYFSYASGFPRQQHALFNRSADPADDETMFDPIAYQKGSAVIHTLREELGEKAFWQGITLFLNRYKFDNVESADLQKAFQETSGRDLKWFFDQWVRAEGYPQLSVGQTYSARTKTLTLNIRQSHKTDADTPAAFRLPMEIEIRSFSRRLTKPVIIDKRQQLLAFKLDGKPDRVVLDSGYQIPLKTVSMSKMVIRR
ncbi:MAG: hypothetical protein HKN25_01820 [Pyrinomonadaceae bacterium]|nr:hypothetical protein [Pyrinomonadaceae bacterium]